MSAIAPRLIATSLEGWNSPGLAWVGVMLSATLSLGILVTMLLLELGLVVPLLGTMLAFAAGLAVFAKLDDVLIVS